ncbi:MAG: hypothetical protein K0S74_1448 [Chlamydiales bacterium]|jgi:hypothetical protein|nr:hypothetical protein [Chlamydiales bacterium]
MQLLKIPTRSSACYQCKQAFDAGNDYFSLLVPQDEGYDRKDLCMTCWPQLGPQPAGSYWKGIIPAKKSKEKTLSKDQKALQLLKTQMQQEGIDPCLPFFIALYLERRKQIVWRRELSPKQQIVRYYEIAETGEMLVIKKAELTATSLVSLEKEIMQQLEGDD